MKRFAIIPVLAIGMFGYWVHSRSVRFAYGCGEMAAALQDGPDSNYPLWYPTLEKRYQASGCQSFEQ